MTLYIKLIQFQVKHLNIFTSRLFIQILTFGGCLTRFEVTPEGSTGKTGMGELDTAELFLFAGGNNSAGRTLGMAYFSKAL